MKKIFLVTILALISFLFITNSVEAFEIKSSPTFIPFLVDVEGTDGAGGGGSSGGGTANCEEIGELNTWLKNAFKFVQYAGVGLAVVLTAVDFIQVIGGSKDDDLKKAFDRTVKRLVAVILLLLTTVLVTFIIDIVNPVVDTDIPNCVEGM